MTYNEFSARHHGWVAAMGWHNRSHLEAFAMIYSEVGEAADELTLQGITEDFPSELADIVLRTVDQALVLGINIDIERHHYGVDRPAYRTIPSCLLRMTSELARGVNAARSGAVDEMCTSLIRTLLLCEEVAARLSLDLVSICEAKIAKNLEHGNRGRKI